MRQHSRCHASINGKYPPKSGKLREFPEVDRGAWFELQEAQGKILKGQLELLARLAAKVLT